MPKVKFGKFYENIKCAHAKNQVLFTQIPAAFVFQLVTNQGLASNKRKFVQKFSIILYLLTHGKPLTNFTKKFLLELLKIKHCPKNHWCDNVGWGMAKALHTIVMQAMKLVLNLIYLLCFENFS